MENKLRLKAVIVLMLLLSIGLVGAFIPITINGFVGNFSLNVWNTSNPLEELTFTGGENFTTWIELPKFAHVSSADIVVSSADNLNDTRLQVGTPDGISEWLIGGGEFSGDTISLDSQLNYDSDEDTAALDAANFTLSVDSTIVLVGFYYSINLGDTNVYIMTDDGGSPSQTLANVAANKSVVAADLTLGEWNNFTFDSNFTLAAGTYWVIQESATSARAWGAISGVNWKQTSNLTASWNQAGNKALAFMVNGTQQISPGSSLNGSAQVEGFEPEINSYLGSCTANSQGNCTVPFVWYSAYSGGLNVSVNNTINYSNQYKMFYENETIEGDLNTYTLVVFDNGSNASFIFNNTLQTSTSTTNSTAATFVSSFRPGFVSNATTIYNYSAPTKWNVSFPGVGFFNTTTNNQKVNKILLNESCTVNNPATINFTLVNETSNSPVTGDLDIFFDVWHDIPTLKRNYSFNFSGANPHQVCIYPYWANYTINAQAQYGATGFTDKLYSFVGSVLSNITQSINLFLTDGSTQVKFRVVDQSDDAVQGATIKVLSYNVGTNTGEVTEIIKTDTNGDAYAQIKLNTQQYVFLIELNGVVLLETAPTFITSTSKKFIVDLTSDYFNNYNDANGIFASLTFTNSTTTYSATFTNPSGSTLSECLKVTKVGVEDDIVLSNECVTTSGSVLNYNISDTEPVSGNTYSAITYVIYSNGEEFVIGDPLVVSFNNLHKTFGASGILMTFFLVLALALVGLSTGNMTSGVVFTAIGVFMSVLLNIFNLSLSIMIGYMILGGITLYKLKQ